MAASSPTLAAARLGRAGALIGGLGAGASMFMASRLFEGWRVTAGAATPGVSILGRRLAYPTANLAAIVVLVLALLGLAVIAMMIAGAVRELVAARRVRRSLLAQSPRPIDGALLIDDQHPRAFCAGLFKPRVYVSSGTVALLDEPALRAVLGHERHHARRYDPLRLACGRVIAGALLFVPGLRELCRRHQALAELSADESAIRATPGLRSALARAMLSFAEHSRADDPSGIDPERVEHLLGDWDTDSEVSNWGFPLALCVVAFLIAGLLVGVAVLAGAVASGSASLAPPFLSRQPCIVVLALIPTLPAVAARHLLHSIVARGARHDSSPGAPRHQDRPDRAGARWTRPVRE
jgi:hypothetical protein